MRPLPMGRASVHFSAGWEYQRRKAAALAAPAPASEASSVMTLTMIQARREFIGTALLRAQANTRLASGVEGWASLAARIAVDGLVPLGEHHRAPGHRRIVRKLRSRHGNR